MQDEPKFFGTYKSMQRGDRGQTITLPGKWCKQHGIKPTDPLDVYIIEGEKTFLLIEPHPKGKGRN